MLITYEENYPSTKTVKQNLEITIQEAMKENKSGE